MGGGGGGGGAFPVGPADIDALRERAREIADQASFDAQVNGELADRLAEINSRDAQKVSDYLDGAVDALREEIAEVDRTLFGGSVAKSTYVEGLSDIDALLVLKDTPQDAPPERVLEHMRQALASRLSAADVDSVRAGALAVTVRYVDGTEIQLLPAVQKGERLAISSPDGSQWTTIHPRRFVQALRDLNAAQGRAAVPAIKLAKAVIAAQLPDDRRPSGYHVEALAVAAFGDYTGARNPKAMLTHFFAAAARGVLKPIKDISGQSHHLDERLGPAGSAPRQSMANDLQRIANIMENSGTLSEWQTVLGDD
jgi:predicted RNA-binding protein with PUA-like domain